MSYPVRVLIAAAAAASLVAACGSRETAGSGTPAPMSSRAPTPSASPSGSGVAALSAEEILGRAKAALAGAGSVRIEGTADDEGALIAVEIRYGPDRAIGTFAVDGLRLDLRRVGEDVYLKAGRGFWTEYAAAEYVRIKATAEDAGSRFAVDMRYGPDRAVGTIVADGMRLDLSRVGDDVYLKAGRDFWTEYADAKVAKLIGGRTVRTTLDDERFVDLSGFTDLKTSAYDFLDFGGPLTKGAARTKAGRPAIEVIDSSAGGGTVYVATDGEPYPLSVQSPSDEITFSDYGTPVTVREPATAQILDADALPEA